MLYRAMLHLTMIGVVLITAKDAAAWPRFRHRRCACLPQTQPSPGASATALSPEVECLLQQLRLRLPNKTDNEIIHVIRGYVPGDKSIGLDGLPWFTERLQLAKTQKEAVAAIRGLGGNLYYDYEFDRSGAWISGAQPAAPAWLRARLGDDFFALARSVTFMSGGKITDDETACLERLPDLQELWLILQRSVSDRTLVHLKGTRKLEVLYLTYCPITDAGLSSLKGLTNLKELDVCGTWVTDAGLMHLEGRVAVTSLNLNFTTISDAGLQHLKVFTNLESLNLPEPMLPTPAWFTLRGWPISKRWIWQKPRSRMLASPSSSKPCPTAQSPADLPTAGPRRPFDRDLRIAVAARLPADG